MAHSLSKFESRLYHVIGDLLAFEILMLPGDPLVTSNKQRAKYGKKQI